MPQLKLTKSTIDRVAKPGVARTDLLYWDAEPKGFGLRVTPTGKATFIVQGRVDGSAKEARITIGSYGVFTVEQAREVAREHLRNMRMGLDPRDLKRQDEAMKVTLGAVYRRCARSLLKDIEGAKDDADAKRASKLHDHVMNALDEIGDEFEKRQAAGTRESRRPGPPAISTGGESRWVDKDGNEVRTIGQGERFASEPYDGPGLGATLRAMLYGPRNEAERRALAEGTDSAGGFTVPAPLAMMFIDRLRAKSVVSRAGAITVPMSSETLSIAKLLTDPTVGWRAENAAIAEGDPTFGRVQFQAKSLAGMVKVSRELLEDSVNLSAILENAFAEAIALEFDRACLFGSGADSEPTGLFNVSGINSVSMGTNGAAPTNYDPFLDALYELQLDNAGDPTAAIFHPRTGRTLNKLKDGQNNTLQKPAAIANLPMLATTSVPINQTQGSSSVASTILMGDFRQMLLGIRSTLRIEMLRERYAENHQFAFVAHMRADMQVAQAASFCKVIGVTA